MKSGLSVKRGLGGSLKTETSLRLGARFVDSFVEEFTSHLQAQGYGQRGRSKWVSEAVLDIYNSWSALDPDDLMLDLLVYQPQVGSTNPVPFVLSAEAATVYKKLLATLEKAKKPVADAKTRLLYAAIARRLIRERMKMTARQA